jgi:hypothetical protein
MPFVARDLRPAAAPKRPDRQNRRRKSPSSLLVLRPPMQPTAVEPVALLRHVCPQAVGFGFGRDTPVVQGAAGRLRRLSRL